MSNPSITNLKLWLVRSRQPFLALGCLLVVTGIIVACTSSTGGTTSGVGSLKVTLSDPATCAAPDGPYSHVYVTITDVQANVSSTASATDSGWMDLTPNLASAPMQVDLLGQANNQCFLAMLGDTQELQAGSFQQIRLILADNSVSLGSSNPCGTSANCVVLSSDSSAHTLLLSSESKTGIKIPSGQIAGGAFTIAAGETRDLNIDFNTCESIVKQGNGQYRLKPVLHAGEVSTTSVSVNGKVVDALGNPIAGAMVALEQPVADAITGTTIDRIYQTALTGSDGTWVICPVTLGDPTKPYDVVIVGSNSAGVMEAPAIITGVSPGSTVGTVTLSLPADVPTAASVATLEGQVTTVNASNAGISMDVAASALETVNGVIYSIPLPMTTTQNSGSVWLNLQTAGSQTPACVPGTSFCANYGMELPVGAAYYGMWSSSGTTLTPPAVGASFATYVVDGIASPGTSTIATPLGTTGCTPNEIEATAVALTSATIYPATVPTVAFAQCQ
jgi:hypothetical protein